MIELKTYSLGEIKATLHISKRQWEERKEELLEYWKLFFDYEIKMKGRSYQFDIKEQYSEYEPLPRKTKIPEIMAFYAQEADHILLYKPRNTGSNLAREITDKNNQYNHKASTAANYIRPYLKANYTITNKEWCYIDYENYTYEPLPEKAKEYLYSLFEKYLSSKKVADAMSEVKAGYATKEEAYDKLDKGYEQAMLDFQEEYGFRPYKAGELFKNDWVIKEEEEEK